MSTWSLQRNIKTLSRQIRDQKEKRQQIKTSTLEIRELKDKRRRLRQTLQQITRTDQQARVETLRQKLATRDPPATVEDWTKLVQTYVKRVLGHDSFVTETGNNTTRHIHCAYVLPEEARVQHHCIYVDGHGRAINLRVDPKGQLTEGGGDEFHLTKIPVQDWPL